MFWIINSTGGDRITDQGFMEQLAVSGFRFFLHGHIHKAETSQYSYDFSPSGRKCDRICAGTFGAPVREWVPGYPLQYNLLKFAGDKLTVNTRQAKNSTMRGNPMRVGSWAQGKIRYLIMKFL
jgi:hypothetical protein